MTNYDIEKRLQVLETEVAVLRRISSQQTQTINDLRTIVSKFQAKYYYMENIKNNMHTTENLDPRCISCVYRSQRHTDMNMF